MLSLLQLSTQGFRVGAMQAFRFAAVISSAVALGRPMQAVPAVDSNPVGKVFFAEVRGDAAFVHVGDRSQAVSPRETYKAEGLGIETQDSSSATMVFSNGMAVELQTDGNLVVKRFEQEPFRPNRTDVAIEPSISAAELDLARGTVALSTSKPAAGSLLVLFTPRASVTIQGGTLVVMADADGTRISILAGTCTIYGRGDGAQVAVAKAGEIAIVHAAAHDPGSAMAIDVSRLDGAQANELATTTWGVLRAKQTVYFEQKNATTAFAGVQSMFSPGSGDDAVPPRAALELTPVQVAPFFLPVQYTVSPAALLPNRNG